MNSYFRTLLNNINSFKYISNINRVKPADIVVDQYVNNQVTKQASLDKFPEIQEEIRHSNLKVFTNAYVGAKMQKFFVITLPALIGAATIASFVAPSNYQKEKNYKMYNVETTTLSSDLGQNEEVEKYYSAIIERTIIDQPELKYLSSNYNEAVFRIYDGTKSIVANFSIGSDGALSLSSVKQEDVIDMTGFEDKEYEEIDPKYAQLFDDIIGIISESSKLSSSEQEELDRLTSLEKSKMMVQIIEKVSLGKETVTVNASRWPLRVILLIVLVLYLYVEISILKEDGLDANTSIKIGQNGRLSKGGNEEFGLIFGCTKYRELFMRAERERIIAAWELAKDCISERDRNKIFTGYEKKLIKKYEKSI